MARGSKRFSSCCCSSGRVLRVKQRRHSLVKFCKSFNCALAKGSQTLLVVVLLQLCRSAVAPSRSPCGIVKHMMIAEKFRLHWVCGAVASGSALEQVDFRWTLCSVSSKAVLVRSSIFESYLSCRSAMPGIDSVFVRFLYATRVRQ